jgi:Clostridium P-47 protein
METNGWDTISVLNITQVNQQLQARLSQIVMSFSTSWVDGFSGSYEATGNFGPWAITGGSGSDIYLTLPITSGTLGPPGQSATTDISGMSVTVVVNLEWVPSAVDSQIQNLQFALKSVADPGASRPEGGIYVLSTTDPNNTGFGAEVGAGIAHTLLDNTDKITYVFAQTGIVDTTTATWLQPVKSTYSYHTPAGGSDNYLAILSVTTDRDISNLSANIDSGIASAQYPLAFVVSGDLFLQNVILPALPGAFPNAPAGTFAYTNSEITIVNQFNLPTIQEAAIGYVPVVTAMVLAIDANALHNVMSGSVYLDLPNAYLMFSSSTVNVLTFDPSDGSFAFTKDPNPVTSTSDDVPWYDYLLTLGAVGAAVTAIVVACLESGLSDSLSGANLAGSLATAPATTVRWAGLDQVQVVSASLNDAFLMLATVN